METLIIYDPKTGEIQNTMRPAPKGVTPPGLVPEGWSAIRTDQQVNGKTHKVSSGRLVEKAAKDKASESDAQAWTDLRIRRAGLLMRKIDSINAVRWDVMSEPERREWRNYRQALLDLPQNTTDPHNPIWPKKPDE